MNAEVRPIPVGLLEAPFAIASPVTRLGEALWLYLWLVLHVNHTGSVCRMLETLERELGASGATIDAWLGKLRDAHLIVIQSPSPYLVIKLRFWPGSAPDSHESSGPLTRGRAPGPLLLPEQQPKAAPAAGKDGGAGEGAGIVAEVRQVLGSVDEAVVRELVAGHPPERIRKALVRVERTPKTQIRRSRLALFRFLLVKLTHESR